MRVAVQFPDDFWIAAVKRIERMQFAPMQERAALAGYRVKAPVNRLIRRITETQTVVAEQRELSRQSVFRGFDDGVAFAAESTVHYLHNLFSILEPGQEGSAFRLQRMDQSVGRVFASPGRLEFMEKLAVAHLMRATGTQSVAQYGEPLDSANPQLIKS